jgi:hypothetical protein
MLGINLFFNFSASSRLSRDEALQLSLPGFPAPAGIQQCEANNEMAHTPAQPPKKSYICCT